MFIIEIAIISGLALWAYMALRKVLKKKQGCNHCSNCSGCSYYDSCPQNHPQTVDTDGKEIHS